MQGLGPVVVRQPQHLILGPGLFEFVDQVLVCLVVELESVGQVLHELELLVVRPEEQVLQQFLGGRPLRRVAVYHLLYQVLSLHVPLGNQIEFKPVHLVFLGNDVLFSLVSLSKRVVASSQKVIEDAAEREYINLQCLLSDGSLVLLGEYDLRRLPAETALDLRVIGYLVVFELLGETHVGQLNVSQFVNEDVVRLHIPVHDSIVVQELQPQKRLLHYLAYEFRRVQVTRRAFVDRTQG